MTTKDLAALSDAATQGQWVPNEVGGGAFSTWDHMPVLAGKTMDVELCCKLVNAYRANQIAVIGPDAVERCAAAMAISQGADAEDWEIWLPEATAAIAALTGRV